MAVIGGKAGNNKALIDNVTFNIKSSSHILDTGLNLFLVRCAAHVLNLIAGSKYATLNTKLEGLLGKIKELTYFFKSSSKIKPYYSEYGKRILPPKNDTR